MICKYVVTVTLNRDQKEAVENYVSLLCKQLRDVLGSDNAIIDAARVALVTMGESVVDENLGGALCDAAEDLLKRAAPFIEEE